MMKGYLRLQRLSLALVVAAAILLVAAPALAEPKPEKQDATIALFICNLLNKHHLNTPEIGDDISKKLFHRFLKDIDPAKLYFLKTDVDEFKKQETDLDDQLLKGDVSFAYQVYAKYMERLAERQKLIAELVEVKHDFTVKEYLDTDYDKIDYVSTDDELKERWRKRIKFDLLLQRIGDKPVPEAEAKKKILDRYQGQLKRWKQVDNADLLELYLTDLTTCVDPHSTYMSPATLDDFEIAMRLNLDGIGAMLRSENGQTTIVEVVPGGAAAEDGRLKPNDKIVAVAQGDGEFVDIVDMKLREAVKLIRGKRGTKVQLKVVPAGKIDAVVLELTRRKIEMKNQEARGEIVEQGKKADGSPYRVGVIDLPSFYAEMGFSRERGPEPKSATEDVRKLLKEFESKKVDGVILDLRQNGGGSLTEALALTGLFIDEGPIVQVRSSDGHVQGKNDPEKGVVYGGPLMVLCSRFSASASEILAGALQDYGRAVIVGDTATHGKGTVQTVIDLGSQLRREPPPKLGALKLTIQQFYRVNGDSTQVRGVLSDVVIPALSEYLATDEKELDFALAFDHIKSADHANLQMVSTDVVKKLKDRSTERIKASPDFTKLAKEIEQFKVRKGRKSLPLNEKELRAEFSDEEVKKLDMKDEPAPENPMEGAVYKFKRNFTNNEVLSIMEDFISAEGLLAKSRGK
jgi:carboxyl-terminal processing protease